MQPCFCYFCYFDMVLLCWHFLLSDYWFKKNKRLLRKLLKSYWKRQNPGSRQKTDTISRTVELRFIKSSGRSSDLSCSIKKGVLKTLSNSQKSTCVVVSLLTKMHLQFYGHLLYRTPVDDYFWKKVVFTSAMLGYS